MTVLRSCAATILCLASSTYAADDPFALGVRTTEPLAPAEQAKTFKLPPGFTITLVAADPDIAKPMNLAFDAKGRLWVSSTNLYPFPAKSPREKRDTIKVIELADDGRATKITTFAEGLDIPIGLLPLGDGSRVFAYDINQVALHTDTDIDGKADVRDVLYTGFGFERDTHGMASNFRRSFDGWVYACHGFNNLSDIKDLSGNVVHLRSGNTFRMRLDGSRVEPFTIGQINPFGMCFDPLGNVYTSDSHSKPIYQLLRGGRYEAFDRDTNDGLGLAPMMMTHLHNSTALAGSQFYAADAFPAEFRGNVFTGNVITSRINRDRLEYHGSSPKAIEEPDFLSTTDPWFRPVQTVLGPDGALYIADFYNRIIGHYEVKLDHPGRDFHRGRIWRIAYTGNDGATKPVSRFDFAAATAPQLIEKLGDANLTVRMLATNELSDRIGADAIGPAMLAMAKGSTWQKVHAMWVLYRLKALEPGAIATAAKDADAAVRVHAMRVLAETPKWADAHHLLALEGLKDADALVQRCAADALGRHPDAMNVRPLLALRHKVPSQDTHLLYVVRMALRNQLTIPGAMDQLAAGETDLTPTDRKAIMDVATAVPTRDAATYVLSHLDELGDDRQTITRVLRHGVRYADARAIEPVVDVLRRRFADDVDLQLELFAAVQKAAMERGEPLPDAAKRWGTELALVALRPPAEGEKVWTVAPLSGAAPDSPIPWTLQQRASNDGDKRSVFFSSLPIAEQYIGIVRSKPFEIPPKLSMFVAGHNGPPDQPDTKRNVIRLRSTSDGAVLMQAFPPRHDTARRITWDLKDHAGKQGYLEAVDADTGSGYAWLAFGRLDPPVVPMPSASPAMVANRQRQGAEIAGALALKDLVPQLREIAEQKDADARTHAAVSDALSQLDPEGFAAIAGRLLEDASAPLAIRERTAESLGRSTSPAAHAALVAGFRTAPARLQTALAAALATTSGGATTLLTAIREGRAPATLLQQPKLVEKLAAAKVPDLDKQVKLLTRALPAPQAQLQKLIEERTADFAAARAKASLPKGAEVFAKNCAICHQLGGEGKLVGPQLDGVGNRGVERLVEDILDPNRNVDPAFRYSNVTLKDTTLITGLQKREEGETIVFIDTTGKEIALPRKQIKSRAESNLSIMPGNVAEMVTPEDFNNLLAFLMQSKAAPAK